MVGAKCCDAVLLLQTQNVLQVHGVLKKDDYVYISKDNVKKYALSGCCWVIHQDDNQKHSSEALLVFTAKIPTFCTLLVLQQNFTTFAECVIAISRELVT